MNPSAVSSRSHAARGHVPFAASPLAGGAFRQEARDA